MDEENNKIEKLREKNILSENNQNLSLNINENDLNNINEYDSQLNYLSKENISNVQKNFSNDK